ncbi:hypothetical protein CLM62_35065 [Streptomyces sp. SA15]|uniref:methyltransferase n=1 Tax=Streptomyces sp. SA15 TaxID=934019 RepID=UPI000BAFDD3A|nr:hypothetical protein CLM62_35065 [Streptomyces sp. SA15]
MVDRHPGLKASVFDLPALESSFSKHMAALGAPDSISFHGGDFFTDPLPEADALVFGHVLHNWNTEARKHLLSNAYQALRPGGAVYIYDPMTNDENPRLHSVLTSLNMLVWTAGGHRYTAEECRALLTEAGFRPDPPDPSDAHDEVLVIGRKER